MAKTNLIDSSVYSSTIMSDSMVVFYNCRNVYFGDSENNHYLEQWNSEYPGIGPPRRMVLENKNQNNGYFKGLNFIRKMDHEEDGKGDVTIGIMTGLTDNITSPPSDCNFNNLTMLGENVLHCSTDSIQEYHDFLQDNSEYQWFLDYGSQDLVYYEDMARNIDANLAEVDMDDFNSKDIHSVLSTLPNIQGIEEREMFASVSGSMMVKFDFDSSISPHSSSQEENPNCVSICKSQLLFSPVHESYLPNTNLSVDSLDLSKNDINLMVTCQANKNNYTIAFEGSTVMESEDSESQDIGAVESSDFEGNGDNNQGMDSEEHKSKKCFSSHSVGAMACSDSTFTTWSKIKEDSSENLQLRRHPSGNNNNLNSTNFDVDINSSNTVKSISLPDLCQQKLSEKKKSLSKSVKINDNSEGEHKFIKLYDIQNHSSSKSTDHSTSSASGKPPHNFNLVKLFIKQKSASHEGMSHYIAEQSLYDNNLKNSNYQNENLCCEDLKEGNEKLIKNTKVEKMNQLNINNCSSNIFKKEALVINRPITTDITNIQVAEETHKMLEKEKLIQKKYYTKINQSAFQNNNSYCCSRENRYCSDESTQENGSNTESTENLLCNCVKSPHLESKKSVTEKSIQTSKFLGKTEDCREKQLKVPVYILYPNYSLPNLEFLKKKHYVQNIDFSKVFLRPQKFQTSDPIGAGSKSGSKNNTKRPFSVNDIETLKKTGFKHVRDWESLTFLLPKEYKQFLQEIPEILAQLKDVKNAKDDLVPLFCLSPPPNRRVKRPISCDGNFFNNDSRGPNYLSVAAQSSGFRESSTALNSNNSPNSTNSPRSSAFAQKYENSSCRRNSSHLQSKNCFSNTQDETPPPRPPLPRSILRNNSLDNQQYTCKTLKEKANKRYSMVDLGEQEVGIGEKLNRRRSQNINLRADQSYPRKTNEEKKIVNEPETCLNKTFKINENTEANDNSFPEGRSNLENDMRRLEELLEISAVFGESIDSFTESDMMRLRSQVSKFLTMQKNLEKVSETLQTVNEAVVNRSDDKYEDVNLLDVKNLHTPHNTPEHKRQTKVMVEKEEIDKDVNFMCPQSEGSYRVCNCQNHDFEAYDCKCKENNLECLKKTVSFAEKISFEVHNQEFQVREKTPPNSPSSLLSNQKPYQTSKKPVDLPICEESIEGLPSDSPTRNLLKHSSKFLHKRDLVLDVRNAVEKIIKHCSFNQENPASICLHQLCPTLYAILVDGLKKEIDTPFGPISNSVWNVIVASSQQGPMTQTLHELVERLNRDDVFPEGLIKFNAFIFGLLNARALSGWFSYLRTRDSLLRKYYNDSGLLLMSNTAGAPVRILVDQFINIIETLSSVQFNLDLMYQTKLLHCSLQNLNCLLDEPANKDFLTPTKQLMLFKLIQSIQNSISQGDGKQSRRVEGTNDKINNSPVVQPEKDRSVRTRQTTSRTRPRSGCDTMGSAGEVVDVAGAMKKRWSGVHMNSKLVEAFDRLADDSESDYTDSLDNTKPQRGQEKISPSKNIVTNGSNVTLKTKHSEKLEADLYTKEQKKNILLNLNKKSCNRTENVKTEVEQGKSSENSQKQKGGYKFKRLQQKWERLSGQSVLDSESEVSSPLESPTRHKSSNTTRNRCETTEKHICDNNVTVQSPTSKISKIPRLVTSPLSLAPTIKQTGNTKKVESPTYLNQTNVHHQKVGKISSNCTVKTFNPENKTTSTGPNRSTRNFSKTETTSAAKSRPLRPTSLPCRDFNTMPAKKTEAVSKRTSSLSLNRATTGKKLQHRQRTVRTLTHRLPPDSGHLSFNEGEKLKVVLEVDKTWLLCCRGSQKGLVPKSAVISDVEDDKF